MSKFKCLECGAEVSGDEIADKKHVCPPNVPDGVPYGVDVKVVVDGRAQWCVVVQSDGGVNTLLCDKRGVDSYECVRQAAVTSPTELIREYLKSTGGKFLRVC